MVRYGRTICCVQRRNRNRLSSQRNSHACPISARRFAVQNGAPTPSADLRAAKSRDKMKEAQRQSNWKIPRVLSELKEPLPLPQPPPPLTQQPSRGSVLDGFNRLISFRFTDSDLGKRWLFEGSEWGTSKQQKCKQRTQRDGKGKGDARLSERSRCPRRSRCESTFPWLRARGRNSPRAEPQRQRTDQNSFVQMCSCMENLRARSVGGMPAR
jgi:hypothetical protein